MVDYRTPGVYIEEVPSGVRPIQAVATTTAAFLGLAPDPDAAAGVPTPLESLAAFQGTFGRGPAGNVLANAVAGFFENGGRRCVVVNRGPRATGPIGPGDLAPLAGIDDIALVAAPGHVDKAGTEALIAHCEGRGDRFAILDTARDIEPLGRLTRALGDGDGLRPRTSQRGFAAVYVPWLQVADAATGATVEQPPSGHVAGVYARNDFSRGVHQTPANLMVRGALGLTWAIGDADQDVLNPVGVNAIRAIGTDILVWGGRTLADAASDWRYVPVRRTAIMIGQSVARGTRWAVFEPNDAPLWAAVVRDVSSFMHQLWRQGALQGARPEQGYFVRCGADTTTPGPDIAAGRLNIAVGFAPVRSAEFVVIRVGQTAAGAQVD
ncbi:MAG: phage tail sheath subtilisin-like domain-containing protein [Alphaproteobacteria bacterium]